MNTIGLTLVVAAGLGLLSIALNHCYARLALVELALNEGLPPGFQPSEGAGPVSPGPASLHDVMAPGVHVFLSRNCHACQRLVEELASTKLAVDGDVFLQYVDRPRPIATAAATHQGAELQVDQGDLSVLAGADPLPFTVAIGPHGLISRSVSPAMSQILQAARDAGMQARQAL